MTLRSIRPQVWQAGPVRLHRFTESKIPSAGRGNRQSRVTLAVCDRIGCRQDIDLLSHQPNRAFLRNGVTPWNCQGTHRTHLMSAATFAPASHQLDTQYRTSVKTVTWS